MFPKKIMVAIQRYNILHQQQWMGACGLTKNNQQSQISYKKADFKFVQRIGSGAFGDVWKVEDSKTQQFYTLKIMEKDKVIAKKSVKAIMEEKNILAILNQDSADFIVNIKAAFQDIEKLYLLLNYIQGRDLRYSLNTGMTFDQTQIKFLVIKILKILQYLRSKKIIHRDLKPENIIIDENGFPHLTDFGLAEVYKSENSLHNGGTLEYMAPQILLSQNHTYSVDYYALGVIIFELFFGRRPFSGHDQQLLLQKIMKKKLNIEPKTGLISNQAADFITCLLEKKQRSRLGFSSFSEIMQHPWISEDLISPTKYSESDFDSPIKNKISSWNQNSIDYKQKDKSLKQNVDNIFSSIIGRSHIQQLFSSFDFVAADAQDAPKQLTKKSKSFFQLDYVQTEFSLKAYLDY